MANWIRYRKRKFRPRLEDIANLDLIGYQGRTQDFKLAGAGVKKKKKKTTPNRHPYSIKKL